MKQEIRHKPSYSLLDVELSPGESIQAEAGSMVYMSDGVGIETVLGGGLLNSILRKVLGGENMFYNVFTATGSSARVGLAPQLAGDIVQMSLTGEQKIIIQKGSYLASVPGISIQTSFGGIQSLFGGEGVFLLEATGTGDLYLSSYGSIIEIDVDGEYILDTGHMVAFENRLSFVIVKTGGWKSTLFSGEGFTMRFKGKGKLWIQTRVQRGFISWLMSLLPN